MATVRLGRTGLVVNRDGFGALPIQRVDLDTAVKLLHAARGMGMDFFDTARVYTDSEEKLGAAFGGNWEGLVLATKTMAKTPEDFWKDLNTSLENLKRDCVDIFQFHNPPQCYLPGDGSGMAEAMLEAQAQGKIRFIGFTNHRLDLARRAVESGFYDTLQFPFNYLSGMQEEKLVRLCADKDVGFIAMKALSGGLITDVSAARAFMGYCPTVLPIWGIQRQSELDALAAAMQDDRVMTPAQRAQIDYDRGELAGDFCRACGYCMPCPVGIQINTCARIMLFSRRMATDMFTEAWQQEMKKIDDCTHCGQCSQKCPYGLDTPALLEKNYEEYKAELAKKA